MELLLVGAVCSSIGFLSALFVSKVRIYRPSTKLLSEAHNANINPYVQEIINLTCINPKDWEFDHNVENTDTSLPHWWYKKDTKESVGISMQANYKNFYRIWHPAVVELTNREKKELKKAFNDMQANRIANTTFSQIMSATT